MAELKARASKLREALIWLQANNAYYQHIQTSESNLSGILEDGDLSDLLPSLNIDPGVSSTSESIDESYVPLLDNFDNENHIARKLNLSYPQFDNTPINESTEKGYIAKASPCLFPLGDADFLQRRSTS